MHTDDSDEAKAARLAAIDRLHEQIAKDLKTPHKQWKAPGPIKSYWKPALFLVVMAALAVRAQYEPRMTDLEIRMAAIRSIEVDVFLDVTNDAIKSHEFLSQESINLRALAWNGYDYETNSYVEIGPGNLVRPGLDIEIYDYDTGQYHEVNVESIQDTGYTVDVEVYDYETGEYRVLEMNKY